MEIPRIMGRLFTLILIIFATGCSSTNSSLPYLAPQQHAAYVLGAGDKLRIDIYGLDTYKDAIFVVGDNGSLSLPMIDKIPAAGKTSDELEASIREAFLAKKILNDPYVHVQLDSLRPFYIVGEVNKPGQYEYQPGMTALAAISVAGGFTFRADEHRFIITRMVDGQRVTGKANPNDLIRPGDQIQVSERWF